MFVRSFNALSFIDISNKVLVNNLSVIKIIKRILWYTCHCKNLYWIFLLSYNIEIDKRHDIGFEQVKSNYITQKGTLLNINQDQIHWEVLENVCVWNHSSYQKFSAGGSIQKVSSTGENCMRKLILMCDTYSHFDLLVWQ